MVDASLTCSYVKFVQMLNLGPNMPMIYNMNCFSKLSSIFPTSLKILTMLQEKLQMVFNQSSKHLK